MAAPTKQGLDYWARSTELVRDMKFRKPRMQYGYLSVFVYELLLDLLYSDKGYYIDYSDKENVIWSISESLQGKYQPTYDTIEGIIECLVARELFSGDLFKREIISSKRAQRTFYSATVNRKTIDIDFSIWLLSKDEMEALSTKSIILHNYINRPINSINRPINSINQPINSQSKVKESKVKYSKIEDTPHTCGSPPESKKEQVNSDIANAALSEKVKQSLNEWLQYKSYNYKPIGLSKLFTMFEQYCQSHGDDAVINLVDMSISNGWKGIQWDKLNKQPVTNKSAHNESSFDTEQFFNIALQKSYEKAGVRNENKDL